jgi:hypothetical protein
MRTFALRLYKSNDTYNICCILISTNNDSFIYTADNSSTNLFPPLPMSSASARPYIVNSKNNPSASNNDIDNNIEVIESDLI